MQTAIILQIMLCMLFMSWLFLWLDSKEPRPSDEDRGLDDYLNDWR